MAVGGPRRYLLELQSLTVEEVDITNCVRVLGVDFDSDLTLKQHVRNVAKMLLHAEKYVNMYKHNRLEEITPLVTGVK